MTKGERRTLWVGLAFISPWIVGFIFFNLFPIVASLIWSFCDYDVLSDPVFVGLLNYRELASDAVFWKALYNTLYYAAFSLPLGMVLSFAIAVLLNQSIVARPVFRTIYFLPQIVPLVAVAMIWLWIFNGSCGLLNYGLSLVGIEGPNWLTNPAWTKPALVMTMLWQTGATVVIYLAALQDVPRVLYESAELDGANGLQRMWHITIPMISPVIYFNLVIGIITTVQEFVKPFIMMGGGGGPNRSALFYVVYLFQNAFEYFRMGYACAMAWILFAIIILITWFATRATRKHIYYAGE